jgi:methyl-accepting chemotaxis protein
MNALDALRLKASYWATGLLWLNAVLVAAASSLSAGGFSLPAFISAVLLAAIGTAFWYSSKAGPTTRVINAVTLCLQVALIVYVAAGSSYQIDLHMYFFAVLAICAAWVDWRAIVAYALVVPIHHLTLYVLLSEAVFPGASDMSRVLLHGAIITVQSVALIALTRAVVKSFEVAAVAAEQSIAAHEEAASKSEEAQRASVRAARERAQHAAEKADEARQIEEAVDVLGKALTRFSAGDLTHRIDGSIYGRIDDLRQTYNESLDNMEGALSQVGRAAHNLRNGAAAMSASNAELASRTDQQSSLVEDSVKALSEVLATVGETASLASDVARMVENAKGGAERSATVVTEAVAAMSEIETSSSKIGNIIGVIDEIAFQTNLLALNAGVEAARAGEAGKGFAVVAQEVRELAQRSASAAKEIKTLINASAEQVRQGVDLVGETGEVLKAIEQEVQRISGQIRLIVDGAHAQSGSIGSINAMISTIDRSTQQNASMVEESISAVNALVSEAATLEQLMARFRLNSGASASASVGRRAA